MELGDIIFYSLAALTLLILFWLKFIESFIPLWGAWVVWIFLTAFLISRYEGFTKKKGAKYGRGKIKGSN
jgi:hypothetical protein